MKYVLIALAALIVIGGIAYFLMSSSTTVDNETTDTNPDVTTPTETDPEPLPEPDMVVTEPTDDPAEGMEVIGQSVDGNDITAYHYGTGETELLFIGGIHGGYSFNTALLGYEIVDWLDENPNVVPDNVRVTVIPVVNPDGLEAIAGTYGRFDASSITADDTARTPGRFNANDVDLNRNFDCEWQTTGTWRSQDVSGGSAPFSEPEAAAIRDYVLEHEPTAVVAYYSQAGGVYASTCNNGILPETTSLMNTYADAAGYPAFPEFDYYEITGDMVNWIAGLGTPAISVLLSDHETTEWAKNRAGIEAVLTSFAE